MDGEPKETAVKIALAATYNPDILKDKISGNKYSCFFHKCRKTFEYVNQLFNHQKIHVSSHFSNQLLFFLVEELSTVPLHI